MLLAIGVVDVFTFADSDLWGHIRFGQAILNAGHLIRYDPYSYSAPGHLWRNHEWLSEVIFALAYNSAGVFGLELLKLFCSAAMILFLVLALSETQSLGAIRAGVVMLTAPAISSQMMIRPQMFTFMLLAVLTWLLARDNYRRTSELWIAVPMMALWANFHGGFIAGLGALGIYASVASMQAILAGRDWRRAANLSLVAIGGVLATLINPYGIGGWYAVGHALANPLTRTVINDWKPLTTAIAGLWKTYIPAAVIFVYAISFLMALAVSIYLAPEGNDRALIAIAVVYSLAALVSMRNLPLAVIVTSVPFCRHLGLAWQAYVVKGGRAARRAAARENLGAPAAGQPTVFGRQYMSQLFATAVAILLLVEYLFTPALESIAPNPCGAVSFMKQHHLHGNVLSIYNWGEYLIWHLGPDSKVFIDGRYDTVYPAEVINDYFVLEEGAPGAARVLKGYKHEFAIAPPETNTWQVISNSTDWKLIYRDDDAGLFAHRDFAIPGPTTPITGSAPPDIFP
ncbi:MAG TPA: hypothetical protein VMB26_17555 [Candidatus Binataceae bacterium]|nr:hypothetical protein [Candidatus Binataceae bacterium]